MCWMEELERSVGIAARGLWTRLCRALDAGLNPKGAQTLTVLTQHCEA